jgi:hypothetical protein
MTWSLFIGKKAPAALDAMPSTSLTVLVTREVTLMSANVKDAQASINVGQLITYFSNDLIKHQAKLVALVGKVLAGIHQG